MGIDLAFTPSGRLAHVERESADLFGEVSEEADSRLKTVAKTLATSQAEGLFRLATERFDAALPAAFTYWRQFSTRYLTALCHRPRTAGSACEPVALPDEAELDKLVLSVPPMPGAEYVSPAALASVWEDLDDWVCQQVAAEGEGLSGFLKRRAPQWHQVGRVCFHLAENRRDEDDPFAFLATYAPGVGGGGRVQYQPLALDPKSGDELWRHEQVTGYNSVPTKVVLDGREYVISASGVQIGADDVGANNRLVLIEPQSGKILWESKLTGKNTLALAVDGNRVCGNGYRSNAKVKDSEVDKTMRAACFEVSTRGAKRLWLDNEVAYPPHRATPVAHQGFFYIDSRETGFVCVNAQTGRIVNSHAHIQELTRGDHNWTWHVASNNRVVTSGCLLFSTADEGFRRLPGRLSLDVTSGYMCPVKPALADGRLFVRTLNKLVCYDLRKPPGMKADSVALRIGHPMLGYPDELNQCEVRLRIVEDRIAEAYCRVPCRDDYGVASVSPLLASRVTGLKLDARRLAGTLAVRIGNHDEIWLIKLQRDGDSLSGTCERRIAPIAHPLAVEGAINGKIEHKEDGATWQIFSLAGAASQQPADPKHRRVVAHLVIETKKDGVVHYFVRAGEMNRATHELDASGLTIEAGSAKGTARVIFHADPWTAPNPEIRGPLAAEYDIDAKVDGETITGHYRGTLGVEYKASTTAVGAYRAGNDID